MINTNENNTSTVAVIHRFRRFSRIKSFVRNPIADTGIVPTITIQPMR